MPRESLRPPAADGLNSTVPISGAAVFLNSPTVHNGGPLRSRSTASEQPMLVPTIVQYYRLAYNLHTLGRVKWVAEQSLTKTLANKLRTGRREIYRRFKRALTTPEGTYKVLMVTVDRGPKKKALVAHFGGISLRRNEWATIGETPTVIWSGRSELLQRLLAKQCELCESKDNIEVHHIRKLADLKGKSPWEKVIARISHNPIEKSSLF
ncbi:group II intron reverse transcriptase/maturase [Planctomycetota bacterium]